jgi:hypothetical protein
MIGPLPFDTGLQREIFKALAPYISSTMTWLIAPTSIVYYKTIFFLNLFINSSTFLLRASLLYLSLTSLKSILSKVLLSNSIMLGLVLVYLTRVAS